MPKINQHGQVTIPIWMRRQLHLEPGSYVDVSMKSGHVIVKRKREKAKSAPAH